MSIPRLEELNQLQATLCRALADPKRILILYALNENPRHVSALARDLNIPQPTVSRHLRILRHQSLVLSERHGPSVIYRLADARIIKVLNTLEQVMADATVERSALLDSSTEPWKKPIRKPLGG